ncbi:FBP domain-containing protein [Kibdelosporangium aridum]|uniref:FBP domain-containing protein n=1 Tax=Kibdelosporangium aridum TaxID=2030 RepID=A0A428YR63_KIBAR|nr:FBP domain-containing protein [Kibdelosporangium aridum]RSM71576.1 FBP domain-containing protein [Kibdelosporangium aridum]
MRPVTESEIRTSFVNCTKGEAKRMAVPRDLAGKPWDDLDFFGWQDPASPERAYLVTPHGDGLIGIALRRAAQTGGHIRRTMCSLCLTTHGGVALMTARKAGKSGQNGNSAGAYMCSDLACSLYLRGKKDAGPGARLHESLTLDMQVERTVANLAAFVAKVRA